MVKTNNLILKNISFYYKKEKFIINDLTTTFEGGKIIALLGINGSGKTTLFKILTGIFDPLKGDLIYNNIIITKKNIMQYKSNIGFMPEFLYLYKNMYIKDVLKLLGDLKGYDKFDINNILKTVFLLEHANKKVKALSKGMKQRLNLAQAIIGNPKIILFDEPSNGFDCGSISMFYKILRNLAQNGTIVLISSHHLTEIYGNVDKVLILSDGKIIKEINITDIDNDILYKELNITLKYPLNNEIINILKTDFKLITFANKFHNIITRANTHIIINIILFLTKLNIEIKDIKINEKILEDILINLT